MTMPTVPPNNKKKTSFKKVSYVCISVLACVCVCVCVCRRTVCGTVGSSTAWRVDSNEVNIERF